jgi:hypothetical protein
MRSTLGIDVALRGRIELKEEPITQLVLTEEQAQLVRSASGPVQICDPVGNVLAHARPVVGLEQLDPIDREAVENYLRRRHEPKQKGYSSQHVQAMFQTLEREWQRTGGFDKAHLNAFLERWRSENPI